MVETSGTVDREELEALQWGKLAELLGRCADSSGISSRHRGGEIDSLTSFSREFEPVSKADLLKDRLEHPPFGSMLLEPLERYTRLCQTSGTSTGQPIAWVDTVESWAAMLECWKVVYRAAELEPGKDRLFFAFSFGPFLGFWTAFEAAAADYLAIPGGGMSSKGRLEALARYQATVLCCTPTYAIRLGEQIGAVSGVNREQLAVNKVIVAGEPGGSLPAVRDRIESLWGARVLDHHGMTEVGPVSFELLSRPGKLLVLEESYFAEVVDPESGVEVEEGECGELLLTTLDRVSCPLLRYRTGDWVRKGYHGGRLSLEGGILSRVDDMVVIRGVNVYPSAVEQVVREFSEVLEYEVEQRTTAGMQELRLRVEPDADLTELERRQLLKSLESRMKDVFSLRFQIEPVEPGGLPRYEFKSKRWKVV